MKNRTVLARLAALGMGIILCFGATACTKDESSDRSTRSERDKDDDDDDDDKDERDDKDEDDDDKESRNRKDDDDDKDERDSKDDDDDDKDARAGKNDDDDDRATANTGNRRDDLIGSLAKDDDDTTVAVVSDGKLEGFYSAEFNVGEEFFLDQFKEQGYDEYAEIFKGADFTFNATLDLKKDGTGQLSYDLEGFYDNMHDFVEDHFIDIMKTEFAAMGMTDEQLEKMFSDAGYSSMEEALDDYKEEAMQSFDASMRQSAGNSLRNSNIDFTWEEKGSDIVLTNEDGRALNLEVASDGSLLLDISKSNSPTGQAMELVFYKK